MKKIFSRTGSIESQKGGRRRNKSEGKYQKGEQYVDQPRSMSPIVKIDGKI